MPSPRIFFLLVVTLVAATHTSAEDKEAPRPEDQLDTQTLTLLGWYFIQRSGLDMLQLSPEQTQAFQNGILQALGGQQKAPDQLQQATATLQEVLLQVTKRERAQQEQVNRDFNRTFAEELARKTAKGELKPHNGIHYRLEPLLQGTQTKLPSTKAGYARVQYQAYLCQNNVLVEDTNGAVILETRNLIPGLQTAIKLLQPGQSGTFYIPPKEGYGKGSTRQIPPFAYLRYEITMEP